ncbi:MAG TPA: TIGR03118 family protein, partial [Chthoniobacteraceae bacterium]
MRLGLLLTASISTLMWVPAFADDRFHGNPHAEEETHYRQIDLVSDIRDVAQIQDEHLVNPWGVAFGPTGPFWVGDNGSGLATLYNVTVDALGTPKATKNPLEVTIPGQGAVTGLVKNNTAAFNGDAFVFASEDGTISGWRGALGTKAEILTTRDSAVYKGITIASSSTGAVLLAANFNEGTLDEYNSAAQLIGQFVDRRVPSGYAPFNVLNVAGTVFVTFAKQDDFHQ